MTSPNRDSIIEKLRKLAAFTTANGCTEAEAQLAAAKIAALMAEHNIDQSEFTIRRDAKHCITDAYIEIDSKLGDWTDCCVAIGKLFTTRVWWAAEYEDILGLGIPTSIIKMNYFGLPADVAASIAMSQVICIAVNTESAAWLKQRHKGEKRDGRSFRYGMCQRFNERLRAMIVQAPAPATGTSLIVLKSQLVTEEFAKLNLNLGHGRGRSVKLDPGAVAAGRSAADRVDLGGAKVGHSAPAITHRSS